MSTSQNDSDDKVTPPCRSAVILLLQDVADTSWRMFGPVFIFALVGLYIDSKTGLQPTGSIAGVVVGATMSGLLVARQLKKVNQK